MMTAATLEMLGEVITLIRKRSLNPETFAEIMKATMFGGRVHRRNRLVELVIGPASSSRTRLRQLRTTTTIAASGVNLKQSCSRIRDSRALAC
jgi:hypothetical protein